MKNEPSRTCVGCRRRLLVSDLVRLAFVEKTGGEKKVIFDYKREQPGRGAWVCRDNLKCLETALSKGRLNRALRQTALDLSGLIDPEKAFSIKNRWHRDG